MLRFTRVRVRQPFPAAGGSANRRRADKAATRSHCAQPRRQPRIRHRRGDRRLGLRRRHLDRRGRGRRRQHAIADPLHDPAPGALCRAAALPPAHGRSSPAAAPPSCSSMRTRPTLDQRPAEQERSGGDREGDRPQRESSDRGGCSEVKTFRAESNANSRKSSAALQPAPLLSTLRPASANASLSWTRVACWASSKTSPRVAAISGGVVIHEHRMRSWHGSAQRTWNLIGEGLAPACAV